MTSQARCIQPRGKESARPVREHREEVIRRDEQRDVARQRRRGAGDADGRDGGYLAAADATAMTAEEQARCLRVLERATSVGTAARTSVLGTSGSGQGYSADADYSPRAWLIHKTRVTKGAAVSYTAWVRRAEDHPRVLTALATGTCPSPWPGSCASGPTGSRRTSVISRMQTRRGGPGRPEPAGPGRAVRRDLRAVPVRIPRRGQRRGFDDRAVALITTFQGAGVMSGDLTPECAEAVAAVLDALSAPAGAEDDRTREQRYHDALQEAMRPL